MPELLDARGVPIAPGDTAVYGFGVGRSVAMAEAVVLADSNHTNDGPCDGCETKVNTRVSLTSSGRVRLRVVRRSYSSGEKPVVDVAPDRLVVLKMDYDNWSEQARYRLPPSPLPTQDEVLRGTIENLIKSYSDDLRATEVPDRHYYEGISLAQFHAEAARRLAELRKELRGLDG